MADFGVARALGAGEALTQVGVAVGAGCNLALGCDMVVATPESTFSQVFARRGLSPDCGGSWLLPRLPPDERCDLTRDFARDVFDAYTRRGMEEPSWLREMVGEDG